MNGREVAITGLGVVSPLGHNLQTTWNAALEGRSGISTIHRFDASELPVRIAGQVPEIEPEDALTPREQRRGDLHIGYAVAAARQAWRDSHLNRDAPDPESVGVCIGSGIGGVDYIEEGRLKLEAEGPRRLSPFLLPGALINMPAGIIAIEFDLRGPALAVATACATGVHSIGLGMEMIQRGDADIVLAGGTEATVTPLSIAAFAKSQALSSNNDNPQGASRPWDADRDGFVMGEGAAVLVLEAAEHARRRKAEVYATVSGFGMSGDAHHMTSPEPDGRGAETCMRLALRKAGLDAGSIGYINAHATSTPLGDRAEAAAIRRVFGAGKVAVNGTKSLSGHLLGAAGALEALITVMSVHTGQIHPTINIDNEEEGLGLDIVMQKRQSKIDHALCNSFGFGGTNACLVFSASS